MVKIEVKFSEMSTSALKLEFSELFVSENGINISSDINEEGMDSVVISSVTVVVVIVVVDVVVMPCIPRIPVTGTAVVLLFAASGFIALKSQIF